MKYLLILLALVVLVAGCSGDPAVSDSSNDGSVISEDQAEPQTIEEIDNTFVEPEDIDVGEMY